MSARFTDSMSLRSSATEEDLEEARLRLLNHMDRDVDAEYDNKDIVVANDNPPPLTTLEQGDPNTNPHYPASHTPHATQVGGPWHANYGSVATMNSITSMGRRKPPRKKRYRLPFLILLAFDWGMVIFFSIVVEGKIDLRSYFNISSIEQNYFDLVIIATFRFFLNFLFYLVLNWVNRIIMGLTTIVSALYVPIKTYYSWDKLNLDGSVSLTSIATLMMLLVTFGMPWVTAFFFEFKYLPAELARLELPPGWTNWKVWLWPRAFLLRDDPGEDTPSLQGVADHTPGPSRLQHRPRAGLSASTVSLDFRTPIGSSRTSPVPYDRHGDDDLPPIREDQEFTSSVEHQSPECDQNMSSEDLRFKRESLNAMEAFKAMTSSNEGWIREKESNGVIVYSQVIERKKVFKAVGVMNTSARHLFSILYPGDKTPDWNPQCALNETVYRVDSSTDLLYTVSNAMGPVSCRDFLSIRQIEIQDGRFLAASKAIISTMKPEQPGKVRAENGPCGYLVTPVSENQAKLTWILNSNLKGWLPQSVIDQTLTTVLTSSFDKLKVYAEQGPPR